MPIITKSSQYCIVSNSLCNEVRKSKVMKMLKEEVKMLVFTANMVVFQPKENYINDRTCNMFGEYRLL